MKKIVMMVGVIVAALGALAATWTDPETGIEWTYKVSGGKASVGYGWGYNAVPTSTSGAITIPSTLGGYPVTSIDEWAFFGCSSLTSVTILNGVTSIGHDAFSWCHGLTSVTIPSSVTSIGDCAFDDCSGLGDGVVIVDNCVLTVNGNCPTSVALPEGTRLIADGAFSGCKGLTSVTIPGSVTSIGFGAFKDCSGLTNFSVADGNASYKSVNSLLLTRDGTTLIVGVNGDVTIPSSVTSIDNGAFMCYSGLTSVTIPNGVTSIGAYAFYWCSGLKTVTIPSSVTSIGKYAFDGCTGLTSVTIPSSVNSIDMYVFHGCNSLATVTIPSSVTSVGDYAFSGCSGLMSVTIPSSVTSVGNDAFWDCGNLTTVYVFKGDGDRVKQMICDSVTNASTLNVSILQFVVSGGGASDDGGFTGEKAMTFNGLVYDADGVVCGIVQVTTGKATKKGVKVGGFVMLEDGKKQTIKSSTVGIENGYLNVSTSVGKLGTVVITIGGDGFKGTLGDMTLASENVDEDSGIISGTLKMSYFDAKTGKIKTKSIKIGGVAAGGAAVGSATIKGQATKSFSAEVK